MQRQLNRRQFLATAGLSTAAILTQSHRAFSGNIPQNANHPELLKVGDTFRFALFADPQVGPVGSDARAYVNARRTQIEAIKEINAMDPKPTFAIWVGDLVNVPNDTSFENFMDCIKGAEMTRVLVHGNHDTRPPYTKYIQMQKKVNGVEDVFYSFDVGKWHMVIIPCNFEWRRPEDVKAEAEMLAWLEQDLARNRHRPTMAFVHLHMIPQGLTQLEWYTYRLELRKKLIDLFTKYGNVRWYFNGHVHNGIKASVKMSKQYKGINFVTLPTIIEGRNFGEEFPEYEHGLPVGGYYMIADVNGEDITLTGRLAGTEKGYVYPKQLTQFEDKQEPRWWKTTLEFNPQPKLINGGFESDLEGWTPTYRYQTDEDPAFQWRIDTDRAASGQKSAFIQTKAKGRTWWARDDMTGLYRVVSLPKGNFPVLKASYYLDERPQNGGGFIRFNAISEDQFKFLMMFKWGENENRADYLPRSVGYEIHGAQQSWLFLQQMAQRKKGFFWNLLDDPGQWHTMTVDIKDLYDRSIEKPGAFDELNITKLFIEVGTWCNREPGSISRAWFDDLSLSASDTSVRSLNDEMPLVVNQWISLTRFGQDLADSEIERQRLAGED